LKTQGYLRPYTSLVGPVMEVCFRVAYNLLENEGRYIYKYGYMEYNAIKEAKFREVLKVASSRSRRNF